ncbi:MAG: hypothetical protein IJ620_06125 [Bacteroidales bacterium]|nr:hypothetical protein [Bacteroidales bacterium]
MKKNLALLCLTLFFLPLMAQPRQDVNIQVSRIWSNGEYCSFTSMIKYKGRYYVSFRESDSHQILKAENRCGKARVLVSDDGEHWQHMALIGKEGYDLRDPKLSITPDGRLMLLMGGSVYKNLKLTNMYPQVCFSSDGKSFGDLQPVVFAEGLSQHNEWIWRLTWHQGIGYGVCYGSSFMLVKTTDGIHYDLVCRLDMPGRPGEATVRFLSDGTMAMMVRRDGDSKNGAWGLSHPPYTQWQWSDMDVPLGGPDFMMTSDSTMIVASRSLYSTEKTMLFKGNIKGKLEEVCILPSGGDDNSYTGMIVEGDELWVAYYSKHEGAKASIYLAKVPLSLFDGKISSRWFY